jgi:hypothetical protein
VAGESARDAGVAGQNLRVLRDEQDVVEGQSHDRLGRDRPGYLVVAGPSDLRSSHLASILSVARSVIDLPADPRLEAGA